MRTVTQLDSVAIEQWGLADLTKRTVLVSDTLLPSHDWAGIFYPMNPRPVEAAHFDMADAVSDALFDSRRKRIRDGKTLRAGFRCPILDATGRWILDAEPLLKAGLAWYLPSYTDAVYPTRYEKKLAEPSNLSRRLGTYDFLIRNGRAFDCSGVARVKSQVVRPVL